MLKAIPRYGMRVVSDNDRIVKECRQRDELVHGSQIRSFENAFAQRFSGGYAVSASYGRMAFYYIIRALQLPPASEIIIPALTFWVVPEIARVTGCRPVFVDVDPMTFTMDPNCVERAITHRTRAIVPTHLYGLPCDMDAIMAIAKQHGLHVIEDCAHALGAEYKERQVGTFGTASFFSFQALKPLNTYGGGMAYTRDALLASRLASIVEAEAWPSDERVLRRLSIGKLQRIFTRPSVFSCTGFPILWAASFFDFQLDTYLWEAIRSLEPLPAAYAERFSNVQAALGMAALEQIDMWNARCRRHAELITHSLEGLDGVTVPPLPPGRAHVYYQYCVYVRDRERAIRQCIRRGIDVETLHVDVCTQLPLFRSLTSSARGAERAGKALQFPVYASLTDPEMQLVARRLRSVFLKRDTHSAEAKRAIGM